MVQQGLERIGIDRDGLRRINWNRWILPIVVIVIAAAIGMTGVRPILRGRTGLELGLIGILLAVVTLLVMYRLEWGLMAIVFTSFFVRFTIPTGTATNIPASLVVSFFAVMIWIFSMLLKRQIKLAPGHYVKPTLLFFLIAILSVPYSWLILRPDLFGQGGSGKSGLGFTFVQVGAVTLMVLLPAVMLMAANVLRDAKWFKILFAIMLIVAIPELLQRLTNTRIGLADFKLNTGASYSLWVVALSVGQAFFNPTLKRWQRAFLFGIAGCWLFFGAEVGATWFSGWMPAFVALLFLGFLYSRKLFFGLVLGALAIIVIRPDYITHIWSDAVNLDSNRFEIWQVIIFDLTLTKTNIFFGAGPAGYLPFYEAYYPGNAWVSHNNYVDIFAELGIVGFTIFLWMLFSIFRTGWEHRHQMPSGFLRGFNYGVLAGFVGTLFAMGLGDWHIPFVYNIGIPGFDFAVYGWLLSGAMLALSEMKTSPAVPSHASQ